MLLGTATRTSLMRCSTARVMTAVSPDRWRYVSDRGNMRDGIVTVPN